MALMLVSMQPNTIISDSLEFGAIFTLMLPSFIWISFGYTIG